MTERDRSRERFRRPSHRNLLNLGLVFIGGGCGTAGRASLSALIPPVWHLPGATITINVAGAFLLGLLLETLTQHPGWEPRNTRLRLLFGTGILGGFTTYSALAVETTILAGSALPWLAVAAAGGTVILGAIATAGGIALAVAFTRGRRTDRPGSQASE